MRQWIKSFFSRQSVNLNEDERQTVTTYSMMGGAMAGTVAIGLLVYVLRYSWNDDVANANAKELMDYLFKVIMGVLGLQVIQVVAQAVIAIGGKIKASALGATIEAEAETRDTPPSF